MIKSQLQRMTRFLVAALLGLLGFSACSEGVQGNDEPLDMYGTPVSDYLVKGTVTDETGNPIGGLYIGSYNPSEGYVPTSTTSSDEGTFKLDTLTEYLPPIVIVDPDGPANGGEFISDTLYYDDFEVNRLEEGDGGWHQGLFEMKANINLKKKE